MSGAKRTTDHWARRYFDLKAVEGVPLMCCNIAGCTKTFRSQYYQKDNATNHLRDVHQKTEADERAKQSASQKRITEFVSTKGPATARWCAFFSKYSLAFRAADDKDLAQLVTSGVLPPNRRMLSKQMVASADYYNAQAMSFYNRPTLCLDVGTVLRRRYVVFTLCERGYVTVTRCVRDADMGGRMTILALKAQVKAHMRDLRVHHDVFVLTFCADNGSNMQGICKPDEGVVSSDEDEDVAAPGNQVVIDREVAAMMENENIAYVIRCSAHCLQLAVGGLATIYTGVFDTCEEIRKANPDAKIPPPNLTRWSSHYTLIRQVQKKGLSGTVDDLPHVLGLLEPFYVATQIVQSDDATLLLSAAAWLELVGKLEERATAEGAGALAAAKARDYSTARDSAKKRLAKMLNEPYHVLAYFARTLPADLPIEDFTYFEDKVGKIVSNYDIDAGADWEAFLNRPVPPRVPESSVLSYQRQLNYLDEFPVLKGLVQALSAACPTEASVERAFSAVRRGLSFLRGNLSDANVEAQLKLATFQPPPLPPQPAPQRPQPPAEAEAGDEVVVEGDTFDRIAKLNLAPLFRTAYDIAIASRVAEPAEDDLAEFVDAHRGVRTRGQAKKREVIMCVCGKDTFDHSLKVYMVCSKCRRAKASIECAALRINRLDEAIVKLNENRQYPHAQIVWTCNQCLAMPSSPEAVPP